jgi:parallel beta-helix repeat protein
LLNSRTVIQDSINLDKMTHQGSYIHQSTIFSLLSAKNFPSKLPFQAGLSALLAISSGVTILPTEANASSDKFAQIVVPTITDQTPATNQTPTNQIPVNQTPATNQTPTTNQTPATNQTPTNQIPVNQTPATNQTPTTKPIPASATVIYVNPQTGTDSTGAGSTEANPYKTITYALSQAQPGTVIQLAPGNYTSETGEVFPLAIPQGVTLRGEESTKGQNTVITGGGTYVSPTFARQSVTVRAQNDSTISGVTISNPNTRGTALWIESTNPTVRNNTFTNSNRDGIFVTGTATPTIEANVFTKNSGNGISVARTAQGEIRNNVFQDTGFGLAIGGSSSPVVADNQINQNKDGIYISETARPVLRNNVIENNQRDGIVATVNAQPDLGTAESAGNNIIRKNSRNDLYNATRNNTLVAVGNTLDPKRVSGKVNFVGGQFAFADVQGYWAQTYIQALAAKNIIAGFPDGTFKPNESVTRAQFAAIVSKAFSPTPQRPPVEFSDVSRNFWAYQAIQTASRGGFVAGYPGGVFQPQQQIPRVQVLVSLANGLKLSSDNPSALSVYTDASQIPSYATGPVAAATQRQLVVNYPTPNQLNPNRPATRAEVAAFVYQALVNARRAEAIPSPYLVSIPNSNRVGQDTQQPVVPVR